MDSSGSQPLRALGFDVPVFTTVRTVHKLMARNVGQSTPTEVNPLANSLGVQE